jgi:oligopeptide transport system substrate-binding protein
MIKKYHAIFYALAAIIVLLITVISGCTPYDSSTLNLESIEPITLDPAISSETTSHLFIGQLFSGLVKLGEDSHIQPDIAESWTVSDDGRTYIFKLREDVTFHNGKEVTAQDFKYSWERACNPETGSETAATYLNDIVGVQDVLNGTASEIKGVEVLDDNTLQVTIDEAKVYFLAKLTYQTSFVVDRENVESGNQWWRQPNGTGPFILKEWVDGDSITLKANAKYYGEVPKLDEVVFHILAGYPMDLYEMGDIDVASISELYIDKAADPKGNFHQDLHQYPELSFDYIGFNTTKPPFDDINIRQAFCHAIDKEKIIDVIKRNVVANANGIVPPGMPGYNPDLEGLDYNIDKAKALIANSKYKDVENLPPIVFTTMGYGGNIHREIGAIIQDWQDNLGVQVTVRQLDPTVYLYRLKDEVDNIYYFGWVADYPDPQDFFDPLFYTGSSYNTGKYSNEEVDTLLDKARIETDETKRLNLYREAEQIILKDVPNFPLWNDRNYILIKPYVKNYSLDPSGIPSLDKAYVEHH